MIKGQSNYIPIEILNQISKHSFLVSWVKLNYNNKQIAKEEE